MISYNFKYLRPNTIKEAVNAFQELSKEGKAAIYYGGGTEIVTFARKQVIQTDAVIDIKNIPECQTFEVTDKEIILGAALNLNEIIEKNSFPLLSRVLRSIADHTVRNRLTLGGNICGRLPYREAVLPFYLAEGEAVVAGENGLKTISVRSLLDKRLNLNKGEFLVQLKISKEYIELPAYNVRKVKQGEVDYPLLHIAALKKNGQIRIAFSGVCAFPFRGEEMEEILNDQALSMEERTGKAMGYLPSAVRNDAMASSEYRKMLLEQSLRQILAEMEGGAI